MFLVGLPTTSTKDTRNLNKLSQIGIAASGYLDESGKLPTSFDESFYKVLAGENVDGVNPEEIRFLSDGFRKNIKLGHDTRNRPMRVLFDSEMILTWSAGADRKFEELPGEGDDDAIITKL